MRGGWGCVLCLCVLVVLVGYDLSVVWVVLLVGILWRRVVVLLLWFWTYGYKWPGILQRLG